MSRLSALLSRGALALGLALLPACGLFGSAEPRDVELAFEGLVGVERAEAVERVAHVFEDFASVTEPEPVLYDAAFELELLLEERGFREAEVEPELVPRADRRPLARFRVKPGVRTRLARVELQGVAPGDEVEARALLRAAGVDTWFNERAAEAGRRALASWYRSRGFALVAVDGPHVELSDERRAAVVRYAIEPGPHHVLARVDVEAVGEWPAEVPRTAVDDVLRDLLGEPFTERSARLARSRIQGVFADHGHADVTVERVEEHSDPAAVVLRYRVAPGPRVRIGAVRFEGRGATRASFLAARVTLEPGAWYRREDQVRSLSNLSRAGLFDRIEVELVPAPAPEDPPGVATRDVVIDLTEAASREFHVEPGYGSYEGLRLSAGARQKNLFGTGRILDLSGSVAERAQRADLSLIDPWILGDDATANATLFVNRREEPSFLLRELGLELGASWRLDDDLGLRARWQYRRSDSTDIDVADPALAEDVRVSEISIFPTWDTRDRFDDPGRGQLTRGGLDVSSALLGSELDYTRLRVEHARFVPLAAGTTLALSARIGWITPMGGTDEIPIQERFFNGGENTVRSYRESELGPRDANGEPIGGEAYTVATVELRRALGRRFQAALFVDAGTVELRHEDLLDFTDPGFGVGAGLRYLLPIGPVRLDGAVNPDPEPYESRGAVHLSVGFSF
ncbi:MAG: BamA/TamA family outer membrane protein [Planctomycetes bacterium]|nr:BamA/TamA family outer membrane protein [Planctomycetota bacterium]